MGLFKKNQSDDVVDLRETHQAQRFGYPTPCPVCNGPGYLDSIDLTQRVMYQHCPSCFTKYQTTEAELIATQ